MQDAAEQPGWSTFPGFCWAYVHHPNTKQASHQLRPHMGTLRCCPASCSRLHVRCRLLLLRWSSLSTMKPSRGGEGTRGGSPGGFPRVCAQGGSHQAYGCHVPRSIPCAGAGEEAAVGDGGLSDVGLCGPFEATRGCQDFSSGRATPGEIFCINSTVQWGNFNHF